MKYLTIIALLGMTMLSGCETMDATPITPDTFKLDTNASGLLFTGNAGSDTLLKAAQITQNNGHTYFKFLQDASGTGTAYAGTTAGIYGNAVIATPAYSPTSAISVVVQMLDAPEPGAWDAIDVIAKKGKMLQ